MSSLGCRDEELFSLVDVNNYILRRQFQRIVLKNCLLGACKITFCSSFENWSEDKKTFLEKSPETIKKFSLEPGEQFEYLLQVHECLNISGIEDYGLSLEVLGNDCLIGVFSSRSNSVIAKKLTQSRYDFLKAALNTEISYPLMEQFRDESLLGITGSPERTEAIELFYLHMQESYDAFQNRSPKTNKFNIQRVVHYIWLSDCTLLDKKQGIPGKFKRPHDAHIECFHSNIGLLSKEKGWKHIVWTNVPRENLVLVDAFKAALKWNDNIELKFWDETQKFSSPAFIKALCELHNYAMASDILRYHLLFKKGGVYCDFDFNFLIDPDYLLQNTSFFAGLDRSRSIVPTNAVMGAARYHPIFRKCMDVIEKSFVNEWLTIKVDHKINAVKTTLDFTGPFLLGKAFYQASNRDKDVLLPPYSFSWNFYVHENPNRVYDWGQIHNASIGRHVQSESWFTKV